MQYSNRKIQEEDMLAFKQKETAQELEEQPPEKEENT